jgi:hypothetical protein
MHLNAMIMRSILVLWLLSVPRDFVLGDNIRKRSESTSHRGGSATRDRKEEFSNFDVLAREEEFSNFDVLARDNNAGVLGDDSTKTYQQMNAAITTMDYAPSGMRLLERGHLASADLQQPSISTTSDLINMRRKVEVRHVHVKSCGNRGSRYVVQCIDGTEIHCHNELTQAGAVIVNDMPNSDFFAVCVDTEEEKALLMKLTNVMNLEIDHVRSLSYVPDLTKPVDHRKMQFEGQQIPYGITMVKANQFWASKQDKGASAKVCIIDTGLFVGHEDIDGTTAAGSTDNQVVSEWDSDDAGHGRFLLTVS